MDLDERGGPRMRALHHLAIWLTKAKETKAKWPVKERETWKPSEVSFPGRGSDPLAKGCQELMEGKMEN